MSIENYDQYLEYAKSSGIDPKSVLTKEEFEGNLPSENETELTSRLSAAFIPTTGIPTAAKVAITGYVGTTLRNAIPRTNIQNVDKIINDLSSNIIDAGTQFLDEKIGSIGKQQTSGSGTATPGIPSGSGGSGSGGRIPFNHGLLNLNNKPYTFNLTTPIVPNCYPEYFLDSPNLFNTRLLVSTCQLNLSQLQGGNIQNFIERVLIQQLVQNIQQNVKFRINLTDFNYTNIVTYLQDVARALELFYYYTSIIEYCKSENKNTNRGMFALRDAMSYDSLSKLYELERTLRIFPIPPRLNQLCWFLNQNYKSSDMAGSCLIKLKPSTFGTIAEAYATPITMQQADTAIDFALSETTGLNKPANRRLAATLASGAPNWLNTNVVGSSPVTLYSPNFCTIYANSPFYQRGTYDGPSVTSVTEDIFYQTFGTRLDGLAQALTSVKFESNWIPGLLVPTASYVNSTNIQNRFYYHSEDNDDRFYPTTDNSAIIPSLPFTYNHFTPTSAAIANLQPENELRLGVNARSINDVVLQAFEWLFSADTMMSGKEGNPSGESVKRKRSRTNTTLGKG